VIESPVLQIFFDSFADKITGVGCSFVGHDVTLLVYKGKTPCSFFAQGALLN